MEIFLVCVCVCVCFKKNSHRLTTDITLLEERAVEVICRITRSEESAGFFFFSLLLFFPFSFFFLTALLALLARARRGRTAWTIRPAPNYSAFVQSRDHFFVPNIHLHCWKKRRGMKDEFPPGNPIQNHSVRSSGCESMYGIGFDIAASAFTLPP